MSDYFISLEEIKMIMAGYNLNIEHITKEINTSKSKDDFRLNIIIDEKYVLRINNKTLMTEEKIQMMEKLICKYNHINVICPHYLKGISGKYSLEYNDNICYVTEYLNYKLASEIDIFNQTLFYKQKICHLGISSNKYKNKDLINIYSMWSIIDLAPLDIDIDEKQENINDLIVYLKSIREYELSEKIKKFNEYNRNKIHQVFDKLLRYVFQGDLNDSNILIKDNHFYGLLDFNLSGTEVNINCFLNETNYQFNENDLIKLDEVDLLLKMISWQDEMVEVILKNYSLNDVEKEVYENFRNIILISQYPNVCSYKYYLKNDQYKDKIIKLICSR